jgi:hypothetical protein
MWQHARALVGPWCASFSAVHGNVHKFLTVSCLMGCWAMLPRPLDYGSKNPFPTTHYVHTVHASMCMPCLHEDARAAAEMVDGLESPPCSAPGWVPPHPTSTSTASGDRPYPSSHPTHPTL